MCSPSESSDQGCHGDEEQHIDPEDSSCNTEEETPLNAKIKQQQSQKDTQVSVG